MTPAAAARPVGIVSRRIADYLELGKPRVVLMVLVTTAAGYYLGSTGTPPRAVEKTPSASARVGLVNA